MPSFLFCDSYIKDKRFRRLFESAFCPFTPKNPSQNKISSKKNFLKFQGSIAAPSERIIFQKALERILSLCYNEH